ncbi:MAG: GNAT family N-acetyltransferase [Pirellulaceae bacterium]
MHIVADDLSGIDIRALLETHFREMSERSPAGSCHFLDFQGLSAPNVSFWSIWTNGKPDGELMGCGAISEIDPQHGEIKSMRTHHLHLRKGVATAMLKHLIAIAISRQYERLSLETGSGTHFNAAHRLYLTHGFEYCPPFGNYCEDPFSRFMTLKL